LRIGTSLKIIFLISIIPLLLYAEESFAQGEVTFFAGDGFTISILLAAANVDFSTAVDLIDPLVFPIDPNSATIFVSSTAGFVRVDSVAGEGIEVDFTDAVVDIFVEIPKFTEDFVGGQDVTSGADAIVIETDIGHDHLSPILKPINFTLTMGDRGGGVDEDVEGIVDVDRVVYTFDSFPNIDLEDIGFLSLGIKADATILGNPAIFHITRIGTTCLGVCVEPGFCEGDPCNDGVSCTVDTCDEDTDSCENTPDDTLCDNGLFCDGSETCDAVNDCQDDTPVECGDANECTVDVCDEDADTCSNDITEGAVCGVAGTCDAGGVCVEPSPGGPAGIDIKPGNDKNKINPNGGKITVAILGSDTFDVTDVDVSTVMFGPDDAEPYKGKIKFKDVNGDGFTDAVFKFKSKDTGIALGDTEACLSGELKDGTSFDGCDSVDVKEKKAKGKKPKR